MLKMYNLLLHFPRHAKNTNFIFHFSLLSSFSFVFFPTKLLSAKRPQAKLACYETFAFYFALHFNYRE